MCHLGSGGIYTGDKATIVGLSDIEQGTALKPSLGFLLVSSSHRAKACPTPAHSCDI